jgi:hypothetical protein
MFGFAAFMLLLLAFGDRPLFSGFSNFVAIFGH